jgi:hypothetical protein
MSSDARDWWQRSSEPEKEPEDQDPQATRQHPVERARPAGQDYQDPQATQRNPADQGYQDSQATRQYPVERGRPAAPGSPAGQRYPADRGQAAGQEASADQWYAGSQGASADQWYAGGGQGFAGGPGNPAAPGYSPGQDARAGEGFAASSGSGFPASSGSGFPAAAGYEAAGAGYQQDRAAQGYQGPRGTPDYPSGQGFPGAQNYQAAPAGRARRRRRRWPWITLIVIIVLLVAADRGANAYAEDQMASQFQSSLALSGKPHVTIQGFPFLTQLIASKFNQVNINASNETAGPGGELEIASLTATLHGMHIHGTKSATIDNFSASALVTFTALAHAGNLPGGITLAPDGPNRVKANIDLGPLGTGTAIAQVTQVGTSKINIKLIDAGGLPLDALGNLVNFTISIPKLPAGVQIQSIDVTSQGLRLTATGHNTTLSQ